MKQFFSLLLVLLLSVTVLRCGAFADSSLSDYSDAELRELYEAIRDEMVSRGLPLSQEVTLREGRFVVGEDILPGTYTLRCTETAGDTYGDIYGSLGDAYGALDGALGDLMGSLGGLMDDVINAQVQILGDYGTVLKSFEMKAGDSVRITLSENTALQISDGTCVLIAD